MRILQQILAVSVPATLAFMQVRAAVAQAVVVQQPVVERFGVTTVVSVPDRGSALLGSVSSSALVGRGSGPFSLGTNLARQQRQSRQSVHVWVHDFQAMDAALLAAGRPTASHRFRADARPPARSAMAVLARDQLLAEHQQAIRRQGASAGGGDSPGTGRVSADSTGRDLRFDQAAAGSATRRFGSRTFK